MHPLASLCRSGCSPELRSPRSKIRLLPTKPRLVWERQFPRAWIRGSYSHVIPLHRRGSGLVIRVDYARWGQTPEDLRDLALSAPHARTRGRAHTVMDWVHAYNQGGPDALAFRRTGGRRSFLPTPRSRTRRGRLRRPAHGRDAAHRW